MPIAMTDGTTYENSLDMLFAKDMPSREETQGPMPAVDMPKRLPQPNTYTPNEEDQLSNPVAPQSKLQNDPYSWGMRGALDETGAARVPKPDPKFHEVMGDMDYLINPEKIQAGPNNKDTSLAPDNRPDLYEDEHGQQRSRKNDAVLEQFSPFVDKMAKGLTPDDVDLIKKYHGFESTHGKWTDEDQQKLQPLLDAVEGQVKHLPSSTSRFEGQQEYIDMHNWDGLLMDKILKHYNTLNPGRRSEDDSIPPNARPTSEETPEPSTYEKFTKALEGINVQPSWVPTAQQFMDAPWKEKLGFILATSMMLAGPGRGKGVKGEAPMSGEPIQFWKDSLAEFDKTEHPVINTLRAAEKDGSQAATTLLETYKKIDDPTVRAEFSKIIKDKITSAAEGGENAPSDITNPTIRGMKEGSDWSTVITKPDGTKETVYDTAKIERLRNLRDNGMTFSEIGEKMGVSRDSVNSMVRRLKKMDAEEVTPSEAKANSPWSPAQDKVLKTWYNDPNSDLVEPPALLKHRSQGSIDARIKQLGLEKAAEEEASAKPFVPKGAVRAPETGGGSGGEPPIEGSSFVKEAMRKADLMRAPGRETELTGKSGISTPNTIPEDAANLNKNLQMDSPAHDAALEKMWKNMGVALEKGIPPISPVLEKNMNPVGKKNLKQFELQMDYKYNDENRGWIHKLTDEEVSKYKRLINRATFKDENNIKNSIQRMLNPKE